MRMVRFFPAIFFLFVVLSVKSEIHLHKTSDGNSIEYFDCVLAYSLLYCRRPKQLMNLNRDKDIGSCEENGGRLHRFSELRLKNISVSLILHQWKSSLERLEQYLYYLAHPSGVDGHVCECFQPSSFGKNCEYQLPTGVTFPETIDRQWNIRNKNVWKTHVYGNIVCYETLKCNSGALCLDWREICDGIPQCLSALDEQNCDLLELNQCDDGEYRCQNGMCIPEQFFLDGEFDCLDWSDEIQFKKSTTCPKERASTMCDDHICLFNDWSCGDGECMRDRLDFQKRSYPSACQSGRDQYFMCETHGTDMRWTMINGRCYSNANNQTFEELTTTNRSQDEECEHLLKCLLSPMKQAGCFCSQVGECIQDLEKFCPSIIRYPTRAIVAPFLFFAFDVRTDRKNKLPDLLFINGTVQCEDSFVDILNKSIPFQQDLNVRQLVEDHFCGPKRKISSSKTMQSDERCRNLNESMNRCEEWNPCMSNTRINDGRVDCLNKQDETIQTEIELRQSCARVWRHRFRCSAEQPTCLSITQLGDSDDDCLNKFDQRWFGDGRDLSSINCNNENQDECSLLRHYVNQSWTTIPIIQHEFHLKNRVPYRSFCDTFWDLEWGEDENLVDCSQLWLCSQRQWRCEIGQCYWQAWKDDGEWDCADATDEYNRLKQMTTMIFRAASRHNFMNRSYFVPRSCHQTHPFLCLAANATQHGFSCFNISQVGDGHIDCAGAIDEQVTLRHCSEASVLGSNYLCVSTKTCIPYNQHCLEGYRCPNRSDDELWCSRQSQSSSCSDQNGFTCYNGQCLKSGRCNFHQDCLFGEDEYMCDYANISRSTLVPREVKRFVRRTIKQTVRLPLYPPDTNITKALSDSVSIVYPSENLSSTDLLFSPYWCNRGLGIFNRTDHSIVCFCPPQYYGDKCEFHADRLLVLLQLNLSYSINVLKRNSLVVYKILILFLFNNQILMKDEFQLRSTFVNSMLIDDEKISTYFLYSHSSSSQEERKKHFFNRSDILHHHPYSIRIELYETMIDQQPSLMALWKYPILFDYLPVFRFAKVLHLSLISPDRNPCSNHQCHPNEQCWPLMNNLSQYICLCKANFSGENCSKENEVCLNGYCSKESLCHPSSSSSFPICLCPPNRFGDRCFIEYDRCLFNPCLNNGTCVAHSQPDQFTCLCTRQFRGPRCQWRRSSINLSLSSNVTHEDAVVIQYFHIGLVSLDLILTDQQVLKRIPPIIEYFQYNDEKSTLPDLVVAKVYSTTEDLYLLSAYRSTSLVSLHGSTQIDDLNRCDHVQTLTNNSSPIRYRQICIDHPTRLCFRDDIYLCICVDNSTRVECFLYDDEFDRCSHCLSGGRCLKGDPHQKNDFLCICPPCHSGRQCQFNTKSFSFTLDQLFFSDFISDHRSTTITLLIFFSFVTIFFSLFNNLFSFVTLRRPPCLLQGVGHYLLCMSLINQLTLILLCARLFHLAFITNFSFDASPSINDYMCKFLSYCLTCFTRLSSWLPSLVALERALTTIFINKFCFKKPQIARSLIFIISFLIALSAAYELRFIKLFNFMEDSHHVALCVIEYPKADQSMWTNIHQAVSISHILFPLILNLCSTLTIIINIIRTKMNILANNNNNNNNNNLENKEVSHRSTVFQEVFIENREMITRPAITFVPSIFSLFSVPLLTISFSLSCLNIDENLLRYFLLAFYLLTFAPQTLMFFLYIYPSSFFWKQWESTKISQHLTFLRHHQFFKSKKHSSTDNERKTEKFSQTLNQN